MLYTHMSLAAVAFFYRETVTSTDREQLRWMEYAARGPLNCFSPPSYTLSDQSQQGNTDGWVRQQACNATIHDRHAQSVKAGH